MSKILNIPGNYHFLRSLTHFILSNYNLDHLSNLTLLLPSRRSVRIIKKYFLEQSQKSALILPKIKAIGDIDYDELLLDYISNENLDSNISIKPISNLKYKILLAKEIEGWNKRTNIFGRHVSLSHIFSLSSNLDSFLSDIEKENLSLDNLFNIDDSDISNHKKKILDFLQYFGSEWKNILLKNNISSIVNYQNQMINFYSDYLNRNKDSNIIIAGSTGSVFATSRLIKTISELPKGRVVLQNIDKDINFDVPEYHPQFLLDNLLKKINIKRRDVKCLKFSDFYLENNSQKLLHYSMLPSNEFDDWHVPILNKDSIKNLTKIELKDIYEETDIISLIIREKVECNQEIVIISNDNNFNNILAKKLKKWNININDSASNYLQNSQIINFLIFIFRFISEDFSSNNLISILKEPFVKCGFKDEFYNYNLSIFEKNILRKNKKFNDLGEISDLINNDNNSDLIIFFKKISNIFKDYYNFLTKKKINLTEIIEYNLKIAQNLTLDIDNYSQIIKLNGFNEFMEFHNELKSLNLDFNIKIDDYIKILNILISGKKFEKKGQKYYPKLYILSNIEARLVNADIIIIPNLNEGGFPNFSNIDNWLSPKMRDQLGMSSNLQKIAISAFDFSNYLQHKRVFLTRSHIKDNSPTEKSRFLLKLEIILKANNLEQYLNNGQKYRQWLDSINNNYVVDLLPPINPNPKILERKFNFSVTDVAKWLKNPYYIYAKRILKLKKLDEIENNLHHIGFGNFIHEVLEIYLKKESKITNKSNISDLTVMANKVFLKYFKDKEDKLIWWPRFLDIAEYFFQNELNILNEIDTNFTEIEVNLKIKDINIATKIDRIILTKSGEIIIIDYKTGQIASKKNLALGVEPQLSLEAVILSLGNIVKTDNEDINLLSNISFDKIANLQYIKFSGKGNSLISNNNNNNNLEEIINQAKCGLEKLINHFCYQENEFIINHDNIVKLDDYHLLARINKD